MTVEKVIPKDKNKQEEKFLIFLDYVLDKLKDKSKSGILFKNIVADYKLEMGTTFDRNEQKEFLSLYDRKYFYIIPNTINRLKIKQKAINLLNEYGSIREYLKQQDNQSSLKNNLRNNINTQNKATIKQTKNTTKTVSGVILAIIITVVGGIIVLIIWGLYGTEILNYLNPKP